MKIAEIKIDNFKGIQSLVYVPTMKTAVLLGPNGSGKTSTIEALRFALTGDAPANCIREGCASCFVEITLDDGTVFSRKKFFGDKPTQVRVNGKVTPAKNLEEHLANLAGVNKGALRLTTSAEIVEKLTSAEFGDFLMDYVPEEMDIDNVVAYASTLSPLEPIDETEIRSYFPAKPEKFSTETIKAAYTCFFEARAAINKELLVKKANMAAFNSEPPARSVAEIQNEYEELCKLEGSQSAMEAAVQLYESAVKNKAAAERDINSLKAQIASISAARSDESVLRTIISDIEALRRDIVNAEKIAQTIRDNQSLLKNTLENLGKPICPLSEKLICTTDKTGLKKDLEELIESNDEGLLIQSDVIKAAKNKIEELRKKEDAWRSADAEYKKKVLLNQRLIQAQNCVPVLPSKPVSFERKDYGPMKASLVNEKAKAVSYEQYTQCVAAYEQLLKKAECFDRLVKRFAPKGDVMLGVSAYYLGAFEKVINSRANALRSDFTVQLVSDNGIRYLVSPSAGADFRSYDQLSRGEKLMAMFLVLDLLNTLCGTKILVLDDLNHLDERGLADIAALVNSQPVQDDYDHIFFAAVNNPDVVNTIGKIAADVIL